MLAERQSGKYSVHILGETNTCIVKFFSARETAQVDGLVILDFQWKWNYVDVFSYNMHNADPHRVQIIFNVQILLDNISIRCIWFEVPNLSRPVFLTLHKLYLVLLQVGKSTKIIVYQYPTTPFGVKLNKITIDIIAV